MVIDYEKWCKLHPNYLVLGGIWYVTVSYDAPGRMLVAGNCVRLLTSTELETFQRDCGAS